MALCDADERVVGTTVHGIEVRHIDDLPILAEEHGIAIVENPPLARALYAGVELDEEVPPEHYQAVAEVISYVWNIKGRRMPKETGVAR